MDTLLKKIIWFVLIAPAIYLAAVWNKLPATVPLHYNLQGQVDRYGSKDELITLSAILIAVSLGVYLLVSNIYRIDPKRYAAENKNRLHRMAFTISVFMAALLCIIIYTGMHPAEKIATRLIMALTGLLLAILGNYMYNLKPNYFAGIRIPWTLDNPENWRKTHLLGGKLFFAGGLLITILSFILPPSTLYTAFTAITIIICIIPCIYSFVFYRKQKQFINSNK